MTGKVQSQRASLVAPLESVTDKTSKPYGDRAHVLSQPENTEELETTPTAVCCPNCGEAVELHGCGLPEAIPQFNSICDQCDVELRSWCAVAVDAAYLDIVEPSTLTAMVQRAWEDKIWAGVTNSKGEPRNDEYTTKLSKKASDFGWDWKFSCPLCRRTMPELEQASAISGGSLDYHHWTTEPDQGICLCRECHDIIGFNLYDAKLETKAESWGFESRHDLQIIRLALRNAIVTGQQVEPGMAPMLVDRYNLTQSVEYVKILIRSIQTDRDLRDRFINERLYSGFDSNSLTVGETRKSCKIGRS